MKLIPFEMERWQSTWEHSVDYNLSESGVEPLSLRELLGEEPPSPRSWTIPSRTPKAMGRRSFGLGSPDCIGTRRRTKSS